MKLRKMKWFSALAIVAALAAGCDPKNEIDNPSDKPVNGDPTQSAYMSIKVSLPLAGGAKRQAATRAGEIEEAGLAHENKVQSLLLVLADKNNNYGAHGVVENMTTTGANLNVTAEFNQTNIGSFYDAAGNLMEAYKPVRVFVYCNPTADLLTAIDAYAANGTSDSKWVDLACSSANTTIWGNNTFLMSNYAIAERNLPGSFAEWKSYYNKPENAFNLSGANVGDEVDNSTSKSRGPIAVERSVARLDFKDASGSNNTYEIGKDGSLKVQLVKMGLANMGKSFHYLRHMSADGLTADANLLLTPETDLNYVLDVDAAAKNTFLQNNENPDYASLHGLFEYPLFNAAGKVDAANARWDMHKISDVLGQAEDNTDYTPADYHIWRYVTENTLPGINAQVTGLSTSVVFKGKLLAGESLPAGQALANALVGDYVLPADLAKTDYVDVLGGKSYPLLFVFQSNLYVGWNAGVKMCDEYKASQEGNTTTIYRAVEKVDALYDAWVANPSDAALDAFRQAAAEAGFTIYQASNDDSEGGAGYYCYYFYKNRHRNNGETAMGPMEFATVRNNVYKLSVKSIAKIGYPGNTTDPIDPIDPDEDEELYITLDVRVLPWVVRENEIEF